MQTYIVFDLEWNQSASGKAGSVPGFPFEIIEIGAVKLNDRRERIGEFRRLICPVVYTRLHYRVVEVVGISMQELYEDGESFVDACSDFLRWCFQEGEQPVFCTWGDMDLTQLQKNMSFHNMQSHFNFPLLFYDLQKLYAISNTGMHKSVDPLDHAVDVLHIATDERFHRALADAEYTARVMQEMDFEPVKEYLSVDYYCLPTKPSEQIYLRLPGYDKFVSMAFPSKEACFEDTAVTDMVCPVCHRIIKKRMRWFSANQRQYHCIATCPEHGYVKGKLRIKHIDEEEIFAVKTIKLVNAEKASQVAQRMEEIKKLKAEKRKKH